MLFLPGEHRCEFCGTMADVRPYGPDGKDICQPCALKDGEEACEDRMRKVLRGSKTLVYLPPHPRLGLGVRKIVVQD